MGIFVTGPFDFKTVERWAAKFFVDIPYTPVSQQQRSFVAPHDLPQYTKMTRRTAQAHCVVGALAPSNADPKRYVMRLLSEILGGSATSARASPVSDLALDRYSPRLLMISATSSCSASARRSASG